MFKQLNIYYLFVSLPFILLLAGSVIFFDAIKSTINSNPHPQINYTIFVIILVGGVIVILNAGRLLREAKTLVGFSGAIDAKTDSATLQEIAYGYSCDVAYLLQMVATSGDRSISHQEQAALEHELANVHSRLNRRNALPQYLSGLLVGMGLLGTFIGLLATLGDISALIGSFADLDMTTADPMVVFRNMIERMKAPMQSMAIAFSASMFGLLGSIILGLMMVGIRRLQGDIYSLLSATIARHIEIALSFESISFRNEAVPAGEPSTGDAATKILLRIEERLAETARVRQRALSTEIDDFKKQREDMLRVLTEQTEASNNFQSGLQQLGGQLGSIFTSMEKSNSSISSQLSELTVHLAGDAKETHKLLAMQVDEQKALKGTLDSYNIEDMAKSNCEISSQLSELTVHLAGDAKETHKLLAMQVDEQKTLKGTLDSYKIEERLTESARIQQQALSAEIDDFQKQRADMLRTLTEQTDSSNNFRIELKQLGGQLGTIFNGVQKGVDEISTQISELTVHMSADAKEAHILLNTAGNNFRTGVQQLHGQLGTISQAAEKGNTEICTQISELTGNLAEEAKESRKLFVNVSNYFRGELQQIGSQLGTVTEDEQKDNDGIDS